MLSCNEMEEALSARQDGELPAARAAAVDAHLAECAACRGRAEAFAAVDRFLLAEAPLPADPRLASRLREALARDGARRSVSVPVPPARPVWWGALAVAAIVLAGVFVAWPVERKKDLPPAPVIAASVVPVAPSVSPERALAVRALQAELARLDADLGRAAAHLVTFKVQALKESKERHAAYATRSFETWK